ncbi:glycosyltransferase family 2 protein [Prochlorothrix hollandica]|uniref:Glycosyltransferase n=1 Tax=Prochlorothrix hollandica PCC 9006 = CALU 1027 TaxID=317619 RepID=A0A0M2PVU8_PROHO|nr:glycosyltransferase family 2 protein [Prochlorothrix hollandica]KKJ00571.1 glycosyltransferase [Prochlorothrix hollandica PCC 9006 = CALU 1027]
MAVHYSLVIPIYNEEAVIPELYRRVKGVMDQLDGTTELILVNDGSRDRSLPMLRELQQQNPDQVRYLSLARNFGHQVAVTAGLNFAQGQAVVVLDADLQDPPELILDMVAQWHQGYEVVYAQRISREKESWFKRGMAYGFYRILRQLADVDIPADTGDFCLMDHKVVAVLNAMPERNRYIRGLRAWIGFRQTAVTFQRPPRYAGTVKYTFRKSLSLAINSLVSFSRVPLRMATYLGILSGLLSLVMGLLVLYWRLFQPNTLITGFAAITIAMFFLGSVQLISLGILGEYIGRIYEEVKGRPLYTLGEVGGVDAPAVTRCPP